MMPDIIFTRDVEDTLDSTRADRPLSARMGRALDKTKADKKDIQPIPEEELEELLK